MKKIFIPFLSIVLMTSVKTIAQDKALASANAQKTAPVTNNPIIKDKYNVDPLSLV